MNELHEILARTAALPGRFAVSLSIHDVPVDTALQWLQTGLLDSIEPGAGNNPPTGKLVRELNDDPRRKVEIVVYTDGPRRDDLS